jgi:fructokinase
MKALVFGETIWDIYPNEKVIGGAPFNFSAHLSHLGDHAVLLSAVGCDTLGNSALKEMEHHGIDPHMMQTVPFPTGTCTVILDEEKIPSFRVASNVAYDHIHFTEGLLKQIQDENADVFYFNTLIQRSPESRKTLQKILECRPAKDIFCDVNLRPDCFDKESLLFCLQNATFLKISDEESHFLFELDILSDVDRQGQLTKVLAKKFPNLKIVLYTLGKDGSEVYECATETLFSSGTPEAVPVVSTVGAGDCFGATFLHYYLAGRDIPYSIQKATERCNIVVSHTEAVPF